MSVRSPSPHAPSFQGLSPASSQSSHAARAASKKAGTRCEVELKRALRRLGLRCAVASNLPGNPDLVFRRAGVAVFCDGDFWHGRALAARLRRLRNGHNAQYWVSKIKANVARDRRRNRELRAAGWIVLRLWETEIRRSPESAALEVAAVVASRLERGGRRQAAREGRAPTPRPSPG